MHWIQRKALKGMLKYLKEGREVNKESIIFILEASLSKDFEYVR